MGEYFPSVGQTDAFSRQPLPYDSVHPSEGVEAGFNQQPTEVDNLRNNIVGRHSLPSILHVFISLKFRLLYYRKIFPQNLTFIRLLTSYRDQKMFRPTPIKITKCSIINIWRCNCHTIYLFKI